MSKVKIGTCGHYDSINTIPNGQTIKTVSVTNELLKIYGQDNVLSISTHIWRKRPFKFFIQLLKMAVTCENIFVFPNLNGIKIIIPILTFMRKFFKFSIFYVVIGAWLPNLLEENRKLSNNIRKLNRIYVETNTLKDQLTKLGLNNLEILPNFKNITILDANEMKFKFQEPIPICFFSRIHPNKGIFELIEIVSQINLEHGRNIFHLDIYGPIDESCKEFFSEIEINFSNEIRYCGVIDSHKSVNYLKDYLIQIFPTKFSTEGLPGSILDSYAAGVPVLVSQWNSWKDIVIEGETGLSFNFCDFEDMKIKLIKISENIDDILLMKKKCLDRAKLYQPSVVMKQIKKDIEMDSEQY